MVRSDAQRNRTHLLSVARKMMEEGEATPSFNELAHQAGVGVGTVYRHFADHQALLAALVEEQLGELDSLIERVRVEKDPVSALELLFRGTVALELKSPVIAQLLQSPQPESRAFAQKLAELESAGERILKRGRRAGRIRSGVKAGDLRRLVCGIEVAVRSGDERGAAAARYVEIVLAGLITPPGARGARRA